MKRMSALWLAALLALTACAAPGGETPPPASPPPSELLTPSPAAGPEPSPAGTDAPAAGGVYTDWSKLEPYEPPELVYRRWYKEPVRELRPLRGGYGILVPYVGSAPPDMNWGGVYEYGLMTTDGTIVVDTAYSNVYRLTLEEAGETSRLPVLALMTTEPYVDGEGWTRGEQRFGAAALDGSWTVPMEYEGIRAYSPEGFFLWDRDTVYVYHTDGRRLHSIPCSVSFPGEFMDMTGVDAGVLVRLEGTVLRLIDLETGESVYVEGISDMVGPGDGLFPVQAADSGLWGCVDRAGAWVIPARYTDAIWPFGDGSGVSALWDGSVRRYVDREGNEYGHDPRPPRQEEPDPRADERWAFPVEDSYTGEIWYLRDLYPEGKIGWLIEDEDGNALGNTMVYNSSCYVVNGLFLNIDGETAGYRDRAGNWVFRIRLAEAGD